MALCSQIHYFLLQELLKADNLASFPYLLSQDSIKYGYRLSATIVPIFVQSPASFPVKAVADNGRYLATLFLYGKIRFSTPLQIADFDNICPIPLLRNAVAGSIKSQSLHIANSCQTGLRFSLLQPLMAAINCCGINQSAKRDNKSLTHNKKGRAEIASPHKKEYQAGSARNLVPPASASGLPGKRIFIIQIRLKRLLLRAHGHSLNT